MMKRIVFRFKADGTVETNAEGFTGPECIKETDKLLAGLDTEVNKRQLKGEYYAKTKTAVNVRE